MSASTYRIYDRDGVLLYVGSSCNPQRRVRQHIGGQPWGEHVYRYEVDPAENDRAARCREIVQILLLRPQHNTVFNTSERWADRLLTVNGETFRLEGADPIDLEMWATAERRRACREMVDRTLICDAFEWLADELRSSGFSLLGDAMQVTP